MKNSVAQLFTWYGTRPRKSIHRRTPDYFDVEYQDVIFTSDNEDSVKLSGWLIPAVNPVGTIILCHGHGGSRRGMLQKAIMLRKYHFTTLLFDFRASGKSEGLIRTFGLKETDDVLGAVKFLKDNPTTAGLPILALGQSMGGAAVIRAAAQCSSIRAVVVEGTFATLEDVLQRRLHLFLGPFAKRVAKTCHIITTQDMGIDIDDVAPVRDIAAISPRPVFIIQDGLDIVCARRSINDLYASAQEPKERWYVHRARHTRAFAVAKKEYQRRVGSFMLRAINIEPPPATRPLTLWGKRAGRIGWLRKKTPR